ncbi:hypothetical protein AB0P37_08535 [Streptomyces antimycoticus]|uniref:hypothetical protein n=1 Tax=Streptomyces antimycoticus TaxID=68175 RepID=UPI00344725EF
MTSDLRTFNRKGSRFYVDDSTGIDVPGVTSVKDMRDMKFLQFWSAKSVAEYAVDNLGALVTLALRDPKAAVDLLKNAPRRESGKAADFGTESHNLFERMARGEELGRVHPEYAPMVAHFQEFLDQAQPEFLYLEETVWSDTHGFAGSFDAIARIGEETVLLDWKTTRSGVHNDVVLQLNAYANADRIVLSATGESVPMPKIDALAVLHVRPEGGGLYPIKLDRAQFDVFLHQIHVLNWEQKLSRGVVGRPVLTMGQQQTGSERRA